MRLSATVAEQCTQLPATAALPDACNKQPPQPFLIRSNYLMPLDATLEEAARGKLLHRAAVEYRTRHYGLVEGHGKPSWNDREPRSYAAAGSFFGIPTRMNARVLMALGCVEVALRKQCLHALYQPALLSGLRLHNTFNDGEVSNHTFGIAIDIDPHVNPCCGCVPPLGDWPICKRAGTAEERSQIPQCWVETFEDYGFYWLGKDPIQDTMHFEFLGDPDKIAADNG